MWNCSLVGGGYCDSGHIFKFQLRKKQLTKSGERRNSCCNTSISLAHFREGARFQSHLFYLKLFKSNKSAERRGTLLIEHGFFSPLFWWTVNYPNQPLLFVNRLCVSNTNNQYHRAQYIKYQSFRSVQNEKWYVQYSAVCSKLFLSNIFLVCKYM